MINRGQKLGIGIIEKVFSPQLCETILEGFSQSSNMIAGEVVRPDGSKVKSGAKLSIDLDVANFDEELRNQIHHKAVMAFVEYQKQFPSLKGLEFKTMGYMIQRYEKNKGKFDWHCDATNIETYRRQVAMILYLNDVEEGGETEFYAQKLRLSPRQGTCLFFPPFWTHRHRGKVPISHDKYIITSFFERVFEEE